MAEGSAFCAKKKPERPGGRPRARFIVKILMRDRDALRRVEPCFGTKVIGPDKRGFFIIEARGKKAEKILNRLPRTPLRRSKDRAALEECRRLWRRGYTR